MKTKITIFFLLFSLFLAVHNVSAAVDSSISEYWNLNNSSYTGNLHSSDLASTHGGHPNFQSGITGLTGDTGLMSKWENTNWQNYDLTNATNKTLSGGISFSVWFKAEGYGTNASIYLSDFNFGFDGSYYKQFLLPNGASSCTNSQGSDNLSATLDDGGWHNVVMTSDLWVAKMYIDGALVRSCNYLSTPTLTYPTSLYSNGNNYGYMLDNVVIYNKALNDGEVVVVYSKTGDLSDLVFTPPMYCGDDVCNNGENCDACPADCGACSNLHITSPFGSLTYRGLNLTLSGSCVSQSGAWINQLMVGTGDFLPVQYGNCNCADNKFSCSFTAPQYGTFSVKVVDLSNEINNDAISVDFVSSTAPVWNLNSGYIYNRTGSTSTPDTAFIEYYNDEGLSRVGIPLYFTFSAASVASSSSLRFTLLDTTDTSAVVALASSTLDTIGLNSNNQIEYGINMSSATTTQLLAVLESVDKTVQSDRITLQYNDFKKYIHSNTTDFSTYFPSLRSGLNNKIIFHQFFEVYDIFTNQFGGFNASAPTFAISMKTVSENEQYNLTSPVLDFSSPQVKMFASPLRSLMSDILYVLFGVWLMIKIFSIKW